MFNETSNNGSAVESGIFFQQPWANQVDHDPKTGGNDRQNNGSKRVQYCEKLSHEQVVNKLVSRSPIHGFL